MLATLLTVGMLVLEAKSGSYAFARTRPAVINPPVMRSPRPYLVTKLSVGSECTCLRSQSFLLERDEDLEGDDDLEREEDLDRARDVSMFRA